MRKVKCQQCGVTDTPKSEMEFELVGQKRPMRKYYHKSCYQDFLKDKEFKAQEKKELDSLVETIEDIFGLRKQGLTQQAYPLLQNLRNGEKVFGKQTIGKRYKEGYTYSLIEETFRHCEDTINYWLGVKNFDGFMGAFKYSLTIVIDKIYFVEQRAQEREAREAMIEKHIENVESTEEVLFESNYKKKESNDDDILDFLDD